MIPTLLITIFLESAVVLGYCRWHKRPVSPVLVTGICANLITQSVLWVAVNLFFRQYLVVLLICEVLIWLIESVLLYFIPANHLRLVDALLLSLIMNLVSFVPGWFLPI